MCDTFIVVDNLYRGKFMSKETIRVIIKKEDSHWVAQCLEYDIAAQAKDLNDIDYAFQRSFVGHIVACNERGLDWKKIDKAPTVFWEMFDGARVLSAKSDQSFDQYPVMPELRVA